MRAWILRPLLCGALILGFLTACGDAEPPAQPASPPLARELIFYDWADDLPQSVIDAFTAEYGVRISYQTYETTEEALQNLRAGKVYDVAVVDNPFIPELAEEGLIAEIDHRNVPNFKNISASEFHMPLPLLNCDVRGRLSLAHACTRPLRQRARGRGHARAQPRCTVL